MDRREFLAELAALAGGTAAAATILPALEGGGARRPDRSERRPAARDRLHRVSRARRERCAPTRPGRRAPKKLAGVIVIHENRGLNPHIEDIARRVALEGYQAIAPDALIAASAGRRRTPTRPGPLFQKLDRDGEHQELRRRRRLPQDGAPGDGQGRLHGLLLGRRGDEPGRRQRAGPRGGRPLLRHAAGRRRTSRRSRRPCSSTTPGDDERIDAGIPAFEEALKKAGVEYTIHMYEGAGTPS